MRRESLFLILFLLLGCVVGYGHIDKEATKTDTSYNISELNATEEEIYSNFYNIVRMDYRKEDLNCTTKTHLFGDYLLSIGVPQDELKIMSIGRKDDKNGHMVLLWNDSVYDPTGDYWNYNKEKYLQKIGYQGFNGLTVIYPYTPGNQVELCKLMSGEEGGASYSTNGGYI